MTSARRLYVYLLLFAYVSICFTQSCKTGYSPDDSGSCYKCGSNCDACMFKATYCTDCSNNYILNSKTGICELFTDPVFTSCKDSNCLKCSKSNCLECRPGYSLNLMGGCWSCQNSNCYNCLDSPKICTQCNKNYKLENNGTCSGNGSISGGAIAGIVIGVIVVVILLSLLIYFRTKRAEAFVAASDQQNYPSQSEANQVADDRIARENLQMNSNNYAAQYQANQQYGQQQPPTYQVSEAAAIPSGAQHVGYNTGGYQYSAYVQPGSNQANTQNTANQQVNINVYHENDFPEKSELNDQGAVPAVDYGYGAYKPS